MTYETLLYDVADGVATVTLNRPEVHNAMNERMRQELTRCFGEVATSDAVRVVVVTGAGERAFSAGADIREFVEPQVPVRFRESRRRVDFRAAMDRCPQPIVAAIRGYALGGGRPRGGGGARARPRREGAGGAPLRQGGGRQRARAAARRRAPPRERPGDAAPHHRGPRRGREGVPREAQASLLGHVGAVRFAYYARLTRAQQAIYRKSDAITEIRLPRPADLHPRVAALGTALRSEDRAATHEASRALIRGLTDAMSLPPVGVRGLAV